MTGAFILLLKTDLLFFLKTDITLNVCIASECLKILKIKSSLKDKDTKYVYKYICILPLYRNYIAIF